MYSKLTRYLYMFSITELKSFLGDDISNALLEWAEEDDIIYDRDKLIKMILSVHGLAILANKHFRLALLKRFTKTEIYTFRDFLGRQYKSETNVVPIILAIVSKPWKNNNISCHLLDILDISNDIFKVNSTEFTPNNTINSGKRFYELLDYQFFIKQQVLFRLNNNNHRMLVHMPTGTGKTKTAMHTICHYINFSLKKKGLVVWIAHTTELLQQAYDTFQSVWSHLGNGEITAYKVWGSNNPTFENDDISGIMFCGIQKLISIKDTNVELFNLIRKNCCLIVYDEAHKASATRTKEILDSLMTIDAGMCNRSLLGLTATPGRSTDFSVENNLLSELFDDRIIGIDIALMNSFNMPAIYANNADNNTDDIIAYFQERKILSKIIKEELVYENSLTDQEISRLRRTAENNGLSDFSDAELEIIGRNNKRNRSIISRLISLTLDSIPTIVFACNAKHARLLSAMLSIQNISNALVLGDMSSYERETAINSFKSNDVSVLINYEVLTTGFDSTNIKCVFITRPTKSIVLYSQMIGRGLRGPQMGGNEECLLIDLKDNITNYDVNMAFSHFKNYWRG